MMTRSAGNIVRSDTVWRPLVPFAALFVLLILFAVGGIVVIAYEADRSDASRAREAVTRTFGGMLSRLDSAADMNAAAPPIADALSGPQATPASAYSYLNFTNSDALGYYGVVVLNPDGSAFAGTYLGLPWTGPALAEAARLAAPVAARLPTKDPGTLHALVRDRTGQAVVIAVANVAVRAKEGTRRLTPEPARRLAMIAPIGVQLIPKILPSLGVEDFRVVAASTNANAVTIPIEQGAPLVLTWRPRTPGRAAIARWAPAIGALLVAALILLAYAGRMSIAATRALEQLAHRDSLTGLANRAAFRDELDRRLARGDGVALGMIDLNGFKAVNDEHGHLAGDGLLQAVATELARSASPSDCVARLGGDEFAWISETHADAVRLSQHFVDRLANPLSVGELRLKIGAAIGIASAHPGLTASALMAIADARLYDTKRAERTLPQSRNDHMKVV